jgi:hypothetical protein
MEHEGVVARGVELQGDGLRLARRAEGIAAARADQDGRPAPLAVKRIGVHIRKETVGHLAEVLAFLPEGNRLMDHRGAPCPTMIQQNARIATKEPA